MKIEDEQQKLDEIELIVEADMKEATSTFEIYPYIR